MAELREITRFIPTESPEKIHQVSSHLEKVRKDSGLATMILGWVYDDASKFAHRIQTFNEVGIDRSVIVRPGSHGLVGGVDVDWNPQANIPGFAQYNPFGQRITIASTPPTAADTLQSIVLKGSVPLEIIALAHELLHSHHLPTIEYNPDHALVEAHAYRFSGLSIGPAASPLRLENLLLNAYTPNGKKVYPLIEQDRLEVAVPMIDALMICDMPTIDVATLIRDHGYWDDRRGTYREIENFLESKGLKKLKDTKHDPYRDPYQIRKLWNKYSIAAYQEEKSLQALARAYLDLALR